MKNERKVIGNKEKQFLFGGMLIATLFLIIVITVLVVRNPNKKHTNYYMKVDFAMNDNGDSIAFIDGDLEAFYITEYDMDKKELRKKFDIYYKTYNEKIAKNKYELLGEFQAFYIEATVDYNTVRGFFVYVPELPKNANIKIGE